MNKWVHIDEYNNQKKLYEIRVKQLELELTDAKEEIARLGNQLDVLQEHGHTADEYIYDAEIIDE